VILLKKALRAMWNNKRTYMACAVLISVGIFIYVAMGIAAFALEGSMHRYYYNYSMADIFSQVRAAPRSLSEDLRQIAGIGEAHARISYDARAEFEDVQTIVTLRLMSFDGNENALNKHHITYGTQTANDGDIVIGENFFLAHELQIGDTIDVIVRGKLYTFNIAAAALSPEFVYALKDPAQMFPDDFAFGYAYVNYETLAAMLDMRGMANDISFTLSAGTYFDDVKAELEDALERYGLISLISRDDQVSHAILEQEIRQLHSMSSALSVAFVACSMVMLYLMLKRLVEQDRAQIGTLKAFGFKNSEIILHYITYGLLTGVIGGLIGAGLGLLTSDYLIVMYVEFFSMPDVVSRQSAEIVIQGLIIAAVGGVLGSFMGAYSVISLRPAEAMRPAPPKPVKYDILSVVPFIKVFLNSRGFMSVRSIDRNRVRSVFVILGVMFSFGIIALMNSMAAMVDSMINDQFELARMYDARISLTELLGEVSATQSLLAIDGVKRAEVLFEAPVTLINCHIEEGAVITGLSSDAALFRIFDMDRGEHITVDRGGIILSSSLAAKLAAAPGEIIHVSSPLLANDRPVYVKDVVTEIVGSGSYMELNFLSDFLDIEPMASAVIVESDNVAHLTGYLREGGNIRAITSTSDSRASMEELMGSYDAQMQIMWIMGVFVALAIIYNTSSMSLNERKREYATLRVLGLEIKEVAEIMSFEYWLLAIIGMLLGIPFTGFLRRWVLSMVDVDFFSIPMNTEPSAFITAFIGCSAAVFISNYISKRAIRNFDIVEVLKERE